jgi:hypothetical protein
MTSFNLAKHLAVMCKASLTYHDKQSDASSRGGGSLVSYVGILGNISKLGKFPGS